MTRGMVVIAACECDGLAALALCDTGYRGPVTLIGEEPIILANGRRCRRTCLPPIRFRNRDWSAQSARSLTAALPFELLLARRRSTVPRGRSRWPTGWGLPYDRLLLATGAEPAGERIDYLRTLADALNIREQLRAGRSKAFSFNDLPNGIATL